MFRRVLRRVLGRVAPRVPNARAADRSPPTTRQDWRSEPSGHATEEPEPEPEPLDIEVDAETVAGWVAEGRDLLLVDIREPHEVRQGHAEGALLLPMNDVPTHLASLPSDRILVVYCAAGVRSHGVSHWLREQGYGEAWSLVGGLGAWLATGASWVQPQRDAAFEPLASVRVADDAPDALPPPGTSGRVQAVHADTIDVLFTRADGSTLRLDGLSPATVVRVAHTRS